MDSWPTSTKARTADQKRKGKQKRTTKGFPLHFEAGAVTAATLQQNDGRLVWASVSKNIKGTVGRKLVPRGNGVNAFPVTRSPLLPKSPITKYQLYEQGVHFLRTCHPDVDIPSDLIRDEIVADTQESARLEIFDPFLGNNIDSAHWAFGPEKSSFLAFPMGETTSELNISPIRFPKEGNVVFRPFAYPIESFTTPIRQIVSSPSEDLRSKSLSSPTVLCSSL
ncbi:hypothetical protein HETIRDRAFT_311448 [Heterobasidion irregulare TC 32-1]|uniref:Uncharacterized protein n=1 Tax=Heterobasidion irregulare (strain TC 32-1) TaxID=747525 RepID=W4KL14_HETIT|nr:uncharacterized protein HETIRDRAFT_311448 [Heterobasidion irregulare TC 32-1]ETW86045.1 hypothetical protein HETIRDRAFT_311448 [Heterobasidion irregulare TC 32-1]